MRFGPGSFYAGIKSGVGTSPQEFQHQGISSYDGFIPQYNYQFGETFGKTTHRLLTDPTVAKSPRPLLAPLHKPKFIEDFSGTTHGDQGYLPGRPGYTGFIPRYPWVYGTSYVRAVKEAMDEFDRFQFLQRNPVSSFGKRFPQTYWPNNKIYTDAGLIPFYSGFVPELRNTYALTFNNSTRKAYRKEKRRRAGAL
ncbi:protein FAM166A [Patagioenas fasciata monilis]|uniref:Protein FAM166A n=1 Tax=Patagioenas fasciata monilis TaxID=372326 RepID=A0A1V4J7C9_PATFA|nr:protein FAM166A [Patagioenas fasciata monilis]